MAIRSQRDGGGWSLTATAPPAPVATSPGCDPHGLALRATAVKRARPGRQVKGEVRRRPWLSHDRQRLSGGFGFVDLLLLALRFDLIL